MGGKAIINSPRELDDMTAVSELAGDEIVECVWCVCVEGGGGREYVCLGREGVCLGLYVVECMQVCMYEYMLVCVIIYECICENVCEGRL